jgi:hypothetical protein
MNNTGAAILLYFTEKCNLGQLYHSGHLLTTERLLKQGN